MTMIVYFFNNIQKKLLSSEKDTSYWCPSVIGHCRGFTSCSNTSLGGTHFFSDEVLRKYVGNEYY